MKISFVLLLLSQVFVFRLSFTICNILVASIVLAVHLRLVGGLYFALVRVCVILYIMFVIVL